jgi:hypothetical protein
MQPYVIRQGDFLLQLANEFGFYVFEHSSPLGGHARQQIPTPCDSRVVLHALPERDAGLGTRP